MDGDLPKPVDYRTLKSAIDDVIARVPPSQHPARLGDRLAPFRVYAEGEPEEHLPPRLDRTSFDGTPELPAPDDVIATPVATLV